MPKVSLNTIGSRYGSIDALNDNFDAIEAAFENTLSLDGTSPNAMEADLDMNSNNILNTGSVYTSSLYINGIAVEPGSVEVAPSVYQTYEFTASNGQTTFSVSPLTPASSSLVVVVNGLMLPPSEVSVASTNVIIPACQANDEVVVRLYTTSPSAAPSSANINFLASGAGAQTRSIESKLRDVVSVKDFGATGNGTTDETAFFQAAVDAVQAAGGGTVFIPAGRYLIKSPVYITEDNVSIKGVGDASVIDLSQLCYFTAFSSLDIDFASATFYKKGAFYLKGTFVKEVYLDTAVMPVLENDATIKLVSGGTSGIQVGDSVYLRSRQHWYGVGERFAISKIIAVSGGTDTVTLMEGVPHQFDVTGTVRTWNVDTTPGVPWDEWDGYYTWPTGNCNARLVVWRTVKNFELSHLSVEGTGTDTFTAVGFGPGLDGVTPQTVTISTPIANGAGHCLLFAQYAENVRVHHISVTKGIRGIAVLTNYSNDVSISDSNFRGLPDDNFEITENVNSGFYALYLNQGRNFHVINNTFNRVRHGADGSECFNYTQANNTAHRTFRAAFGSHQEVYDLTISGNVAYNCYAFAVVRAKDATIVGNSNYTSISDAQPTWGVGTLTTTIQTQNSDDPGIIVITGNSFITNGANENGAIFLGSALETCVISNNTITQRSGNAIRIISAVVKNVNINDNSITFSNPDSVEYPGGSVPVNPSSGIVVAPENLPADYAAYFGSQRLNVNVDGVSISGNTINNYGGTATFPGSGHGIVLTGAPTPYSDGIFRNILVTGNVGRPQTEDSSFFVRVNPGGYVGSNFVVSNNSVYGDSNALFGIASADGHLFYEAPRLINNIGFTDAQKTHLSGGSYTALGNGTTVIKGTTFENPQPGPGQASEYICTTSGTTGTLTAGITATTTSGSPTVTLVNNSIGDSYVVPGSYISIAGANTGVRVIAVSSDYATITLESNASASVSGAAVTRFNPVYNILSGVGGTSPLQVVTGTTVTASSGVQYALTNASASTLTLPVSPSVGDFVKVVVANGRTDNVVARNGSNIMSSATNLTLNVANTSVELRYINATIGWSLV